MAQARKARMGVHEPDALAEHDRAEVREEREEVGERGGAGDGREGDVVDFEAWGEIADAGAVWRVGVGEDDDFVPSAEELGAEDVDVVLDAADVGEEEVGYHPVESLKVVLRQNSWVHTLSVDDASRCSLPPLHLSLLCSRRALSPSHLRGVCFPRSTAADALANQCCC